MIFSCRRATELIEGELVGPRLTWLQRLQLKSHLIMCSLCCNYRSQVIRLRTFFRGPDWESQLPGLSDSARERIRNRLRPEIDQTHQSH
jgi:hypothetical protein